MSEFNSKFSRAKKQAVTKTVIPEHLIREHQLTQGVDEYDSQCRVLRHASQQWHDSWRCFKYYKQERCDVPWLPGRGKTPRNESDGCFWCDKFHEERNQLADENNTRYIPPRKTPSYIRNDESQQGVYISYSLRRCLDHALPKGEGE